MKKILVCGLVVAVVLIISFSVTCSSTQKPVDNVVGLLPGNTDLMIKLGSAEMIYKHFSVTENSIFGEPVEDIKDIKKKVGFNPFVISDLKSNGFDTGKEIGFIINDFKYENEKPDFNFLLFVPVTNGQKVIDKIKTWAKNENPNVRFSQDGKIVSVEEGASKFYMFLKNNYLFAGTNVCTDAKPFIKSVEAGKTSLLSTKFYKDVTAKISADNDIFAYINTPKIMMSISEAMKNISEAEKKSGFYQGMVRGINKEYVDGYEGACISADLDNKDLVINGIGNMVSGSKIMDIWKGIKFKKKMVLGFRENPALLASFAVNTQEYYKMIMSTLSETEMNKYRKTLEESKKDSGIDLEKEVIENLAGNINIGIYDGLSINATNYNTLLTLSLKDEALMKKVIEKGIAKIPPEQQQMVVKTKIGNLDTYVFSLLGITQLYVGIQDNNLIVSVGKPMFEKAISGKVSSGFTSSMKDKKLAKVIKRNDTNLFYLNIGEVYSAFRNLSQMRRNSKPVDPKIEQAISQFEYLLSTSRIEGTSALSNLTVKTKFSEPFFKGLMNVSKILRESFANKKPEPLKKENEASDPKKQS